MSSSIGSSIAAAAASRGIKAGIAVIDPEGAFKAAAVASTAETASASEGEAREEGGGKGAERTGKEENQEWSRSSWAPGLWEGSVLRE
jgi:hypothetical protein